MSFPRSSRLIPIEFSRGIWAENFFARYGGGDDVQTVDFLLSTSRFQMQESPEGFVDDIVNMMFTDDGKLITRPGVFPKNSMAVAPNSAAANKQYVLPCNVYGPEGGRVISMKVSGTGPYTYSFNWQDGATQWFDRSYSAFSVSWYVVYYDNWWYFFNNASAALFPPFRVNGDGSVETDISAFNTANPNGLSRDPLMYKDRVFVIDNIRPGIAYSKATDPTVWASPDGGFFSLPTKALIYNMVLYKDVLYIADTHNQIWEFYFQSDPGTDGVLRKVLQDKYVMDWKVSDNRLFFVTGDGLFELVNNYPSKVSDAIDFTNAPYDDVVLIDLGWGLLVCTYFDSTQGNWPRYWVYHHKQQAWTRWEFQWFTAGSQLNKDVVLHAGIYEGRKSGNRVHLYIGAPSAYEIITGFGNAHFPQYYMIFNGPSQRLGSDRYNRALDGTVNNYTYQQIAIKFISRVMYLGSKHIYKKFKFIQLNAFLGWWRDGAVRNNEPFKTTIEYIPTGVADKVSSTTLERTSQTDHAEYPYVIPINQRARGVRFTVETEDLDTFVPADAPNVYNTDANDEVYGTDYIVDVAVAVAERAGASRPLFGDGAYSDSRSK